MSDILIEQRPEISNKIRRLTHNESINPIVIQSAGINGLLPGLVSTNNIQDLQTCLTYNNIPLKYFDTALEIACNNDNQKIIDILLNDKRVTYSTGNNCIFQRACRLGQEEFVSQLLADPNVDPSVNNNIAFMNACKKGHTNIVNMLIDHPRINITVDNFNALLYVCIYGHEDIVNILLPYNNQDINFNIKLITWTHTKYCMNKSMKLYNIIKLLFNAFNYTVGNNIHIPWQLRHVYNDSSLLFLQ